MNIYINLDSIRHFFAHNMIQFLNETWSHTKPQLERHISGTAVSRWLWQISPCRRGCFHGPTVFPAHRAHLCVCCVAEMKQCLLPRASLCYLFGVHVSKLLKSACELLTLHAPVVAFWSDFSHLFTFYHFLSHSDIVLHLHISSYLFTSLHISSHLFTSSVFTFYHTWLCMILWMSYLVQHWLSGGAAEPLVVSITPCGEWQQDRVISQ